MPLAEPQVTHEASPWQEYHLTNPLCTQSPDSLGKRQHAREAELDAKMILHPSARPVCSVCPVWMQFSTAKFEAHGFLETGSQE